MKGEGLAELSGLKKASILFFATGTGSGFIPFFPGTFGTVWGVVIAFFLSGLSYTLYGAAVFLVIAASVFFADRARNIFSNEKDPRYIVCDEIAGFCVASFLIPFTPLNTILVFIIFRIFDILKPFPAGLIDRRLTDGVGIVLDDVCAGIYANILSQLILKFIL